MNETQAAIRDPNPVVVLEHELMYGTEFEVSDECMDKDYCTPFGKAKVMKAGTDITIVTFARMVGKCLEAAAALEKEGISVEVINLRSIRPMDTKSIIESVKKTNRLVTVEEGWPQQGIGSEICAVVMESEAFDYLDAPVERITGADLPMPYAENLENLCLPQINDVITVCKRVVGRKL
jgi:pyruvate dehydrogenase E1 component beta subunit